MNASPWLHSRGIPAICPKCNAPALHRSHAQSRLEHKRKHLTGKRPYRCHVCGWRGWFEELELRFPTSAQHPLPPEVAGTDVPIPDFQLDDTHEPAAHTGIPQDIVRGKGTGAGNASEDDPLSASAPDGPRNDDGKNGDSSFSVLGMDIPGSPARAGDSASVSRQPQEGPLRDRNAASSIRGPAPRKSATRRTSASAPNGSRASTEDPIEARSGSDEDDFTTRPPDFDERSGHPVSNKVTAAFHHHARNKSWACPKCGEFSLYRSRARTFRESLKKKFTSKRPFRCHRCGWRGWLTR